MSKPVMSPAHPRWAELYSRFIDVVGSPVDLNMRPPHEIMETMLPAMLDTLGFDVEASVPHFHANTRFEYMDPTYDDGDGESEGDEKASWQ